MSNNDTQDAPVASSPSTSTSASASPISTETPTSSMNGSIELPAELFIPSHTRGWDASTRARYDKYCQQHELEPISHIISSASTVDHPAVSAASTPAPFPILSPADINSAVNATSAALNAPPPVGSLDARGQIIQLGDQAIVDFGRGKAWLNLDGMVTNLQQHTYTSLYKADTALRNRMSDLNLSCLLYVFNCLSQPNRTLRLAKQTAKVSNLPGQSYGCVWELDNKSQLLSRTTRKRGLGTTLLDSSLPDTARNNSQLYDTNAAQALSQEEIEAFKDAGTTTGTELVDMLISNSATFASKTEFSQEKYIKKKKLKHCTELQVLPVSLGRVIETFWEKDRAKLRGLRPDTLALLLSTANVRAGASSLVVESCSGAILGALMYRTQGLAYVVHAFENNQKRTEGVKRFNFSPDITAALLHVPLDKLLSKQVPVNGDITVRPTTSVTPAASATIASMDTTDSAADAADVSNPEGDLSGEQLLSQQVDILILASRYEPFALLQSLWAYLRPGGRFVVYEEVLEPLAAAHAKLSAHEMGVNITLSEQFFRHHQVLPNRTHPHVNMSASGGYILSGSKMRGKQ
jgi:tRNA (adenine-N(1)-)-methyltransferase non-catalytic subunit